MPAKKKVIDERFFFNGINITTGKDLLAPMTPQDVLAMAKGQRKKQDLDQDLKAHADQLANRHERKTQRHLGPVEGVDEKDLAQTGWGLILGSDDPDAPKILEALKELRDYRQGQAAKINEKRYRVYSGADGYWPGDTGIKFMGRHGADASKPVRPDKSPYYLLIAGDPARIPYRFQYQLDVQYAVGRIHFRTMDEYAQYAHSVVEAEKKLEAQEWSLPRRAVFFGVANEGDAATALSADHLAKPLARAVAKDHTDWAVQSVLKKGATKARLAHLLGGDETPALLFTASHGAGLPSGHPDQQRYQGALICQDWVRTGWPEDQPIPPDYFFSADDVGDDARLLGLIAFHFACFGAGTPLLNDFPYYDDSWDPISTRSFVAHLPQRLLGHPKGGALAVVGHVDRAWESSFTSSYGGVRQAQTQVFESAFKRLMDGYPLGSAMEYFNDSYAALSAFLTDEIQYLRQGKVPDPASAWQLAGLWTANNDARGYVIVGDPAVKLAAGRDKADPADRPAIDTVTVSAETPPQEQPETSYGTAAGGPAGPQSYTLSGTVFLQPSGALEVRLGAAAGLDVMGQPVDYAIFGGKGAEIKEKLVTAIQDFADKVGQAVEDAIKNVANLKVTTYTAAEMKEVDKDHLDTTATLSAFTRITPTGDLEVCVPVKDGQVDQALWTVHLEMVRQAQANRNEMIKAVVEAVTGLAKVL